MKIGLDLGYSNCKVVFGNNAEDVQMLVKPVGAGPAALMPEAITKGAEDYYNVTVNNEPWVAAVEPDRLEGYERELHAEYVKTGAYKALYHASLLMTGVKEVDEVITGLPVNQYKEEWRREALKEMLTGTHQVTPKRQVTVKSVKVLPQPAGAYVSLIHSADDDLLETIEEGRLLVLDPGYYSVDFCVLERGEVRYQSSGSSLKATSKILEQVNEMISKDHGARPTVEKIERSLRGGKESVLVFGERVALKPYLDQAREYFAPEALKAVRKALREDGDNIDIVLLAGGGAEFYADACQELFPKSKTVVGENSVLSNALGFWYRGGD